MKLNKQALLLIGIVLIGFTAYSLVPNFEREEFNPEVIENISSGKITTTTLEQKNSNEIEEEIPNVTEEELFEETIYDTLLINNQTERINDIFTTYLVIGSDERTSSSSASRGYVAGSRADVIILVLLDKESNPTLISIPRDLLIKDPCSQKIQRINSSYVDNDCGTGAENLSAALLNVTGLKVNHFAKFSFEGFEEIIDSFGGIEICVNETQREGYSFEIQKGCNILPGDIA
jgi:LCP family protein required for cell wall assembly